MNDEKVKLVDDVADADKKVLSSIQIEIVQGELEGKSVPLMQINGPLDDVPLFIEMIGRALNTFSLNTVKLQKEKPLPDLSLINIPEMVDYMGMTLTSLGATIKKNRETAFKYNQLKSDANDVAGLGLGLVPPGTKIN